MKQIKMFRQGVGSMSELNEKVNTFLKSIAGCEIEDIKYKIITRGDNPERTNVYITYEVIEQQ